MRSGKGAEPLKLNKPRLLSENAPYHISGALADWLKDQKMDHVSGAPYHPQTQGKIALVTWLRNALPGNGTLAPDLEKPRPPGTG